MSAEITMPQLSDTTIEVASAGEVHDLADTLHGATREDINTDPRLRHGGDDGRGRRIKVSPLARRIAEEAGVDLTQVQGTGPGGRIVQADVLAVRDSGGAGAIHASGGAERGMTTDAGSEVLRRPGSATQEPGSSASLSPGVGGAPAVLEPAAKQVVPFTKMRAAIAAALLRSKQTIPHYYETIDIDAESVLELRQRLNARLEKENVRLSLSDFIVKALAFALKSHPVLNSRFNPETNEVTRYADVNLGMAVAVPDGLIVPVLRGVNRMGLKEIRQRSADLIDRARALRLRREEQTEGTFTITSLGAMGVREFSAIVNPPEVAILAVGAAEKRPVVRDGAIVARTMMSVTLSLDHRVVDGAVAAEFLQTLKGAIEEPAMMLA